MRSWQVVATLLLEQALHLGGGDRAQVDLVGAALSGGSTCSVMLRAPKRRCEVCVLTGPMVAHRRLFRRDRGRASGRLSATRCGRPARPASASAAGRVAEGALLAHQVDQGVRRLHAQRAHLARADQHLPGQRDARPQRLGGDLGDAVRHLAGAAGEVEGALAGDHQVGRAGPGRRGRRPRRRRRCPASRVGAEQQQREARGRRRRRRPSPARYAGRSAAASSSQHSRRRPAAAPRRCPSAGRRSWWRRTARSAGCRRRWRPPARRPRTGPGPRPGRPRVSPARPARPGVQAAASAVAPRAASRPAPPSLVPLPPRPTTIRSAPASERRGRPARRRRACVALSGALAARSGAGRRPGRSRRTPCSPTQQHRRRAPARRAGPRTVTAEQLAAQRRVQHVDEARAAVGHRREVELVVGRLARASRRRWPRRPRPRSACRRTCPGRPERACGHPARAATVSLVTGRRPRRDVDPADAPRGRPAAERLSAEGFHELDTPQFRRSLARARAPARRRAAPAGSPAPGTCCGTDPGRLLGRRGRRRAARRRDVVQPRDCCGCLAVVRRAARRCRAAGIGKAAARGRAAPRPRLPARDARRRPRTRRRCAATGWPASRCTRRCSCAGTVDRRRSRWSRRSARARAGDIDLMDSIDRQTRGAAHGADHEVLLAHCRLRGVRHVDRHRATPTSTGGGRRAARGDQPAYGDPAAVGGARRRPTGRRRWSATSPPRTSGRSTSGWRPGCELRTRRATSALRGHDAADAVPAPRRAACERAWPTVTA